MNIHQQNLLKLVKEIDAFCRKHDITYYCAGGTVIGAARHSGFIPWDDDIDIYMTRKEFLRFAEAFRKDPPPGRTFEYYEGNHEHQTMVARYHEEGTTMFCHYNMFGYSSAGAMIDVFALDPIPDGQEAQWEYIAKLYAYSDLVSPSISYSHRIPRKYFPIYDECRRIMAEKGREEAIQWISDQLFIYDESECSNYSLRWGSVPLIYPIDVIGKPVYLPFEDTEIPVPEHWYEYLVIHYGANWMELPYVDYQREHRVIIDYDKPYQPIYQKRDSIYTQEYLLDLHFRWKDAMRNQIRVERDMEEFAKDLQNSICAKHIAKNLAKAGASSLQELFDDGRCEDVVRVMDPYIKLQTHYTYMGELMRHGSQYHWVYPLICPIPDQDRHVLLHSLLRTGRIRVVEKLVGLHQRGNVYTDSITSMQKLLDQINEAIKHYYYIDKSRCEELILQIPDHDKIPILRDYLMLSIAERQLTEDEEQALAAAAAAEGASDGIRKAWGDHLYSLGRREEAEKVYQDLMATCRNGLFYNDMIAKGMDVPEIPIEQPSDFVHSELSAAQTLLLEEIVTICEKYDIRYVVGPRLARRMFRTGNPGFENGAREVFMDADNAAKFMEAFKKEHPENRRLLSWAEGDNITNFALVYSDTKSVYCDLRRLEQWRNLGVYIAVRILRRKDAPALYRKKTYYDEFLVNLMSLEPLDMRKLVTRKKKIAYALENRFVTEEQRANYHRKLFARSMEHEMGPCKGDYYYYKNVRGDRPNETLVPRADWKKRATVEMFGRKYKVPSCAVKPYFPKEPRLSNRIPRFSIYFYRSDEMTWDEINPLIDNEKYLSLDWEGLAKARKEAQDLEYSVRRSWRMILKLNDEAYLTHFFREEGGYDELEKAFQDNDIEQITEILRETNGVVKRNMRREVPVDLDPPLQDYYFRFLRMSGQDEVIDILEELWNRDPGTFYNNA